MSNLALEYANSLADGWSETGLFGEEIDEDGDVTFTNAGDWLEGVLDFEIRINARGEFRSVELLVTFGGPNAYLELTGSGSGLLTVYWGDKAERRIVHPDFDEVYAYVEEMYSEGCFSNGR